MVYGSSLSVQEAAERLGVRAAGVRHHIASGRLPAVKRGRDWWLDARAVERMARQPVGRGRALSPEMAWSVVLFASGDDETAAAVAGRDRYIARARAWLDNNPLSNSAPRLRARAQLEEFDAHPAEIRRVLERSDLMLTGASADGVLGLVGGHALAEVYAPVRQRRALVEEHGLDPAAGPLRIRWVRDDLWPLVRQASASNAPAVAVLLDLLENDDPRVRREAARMLQG